MNVKKILFPIQQLTIGIVISSLCSSSVLAQSVLNRAAVYKIRNQVEINRQNQSVWNRAKLGEAIIPQDKVRTGANSRADLLFNEGTLVRTGAGTIFRFLPNKRNFELTSGAALIMIRPGKGQSNIITPEARVVSQGTALFVQHDPRNNASLVGVLTNSPQGAVKVSNANGEVTIELNAGQFVSIVNGVVGLVEYFVLPMFYETVELAAGLGTGQEQLVAAESPEVQATINAIRQEAIAPLASQVAWLNGFCRFNVNLEQVSPLLQWLGLGVPGTEVSLRLPQTDLFVIPMRSLAGLAWLSNYCQTNFQGNPIRNKIIND
ncbi:MAG: FecR family protein [Xenococcaceae cyanobacterium MO_234.B1]|nr:FecR family protein [Xenococcaceae cyanobacterium MO_234.B1]